MTLQEIRDNVKNGVPVTEVEYAYLLRNDPSAFFGFLVNNNPGNLNDILRHKLGYISELGFEPDKKAIARILDIIIESGNEKEFNYIVENAKIDVSKVSPELYGAIQNGDYSFIITDSQNERTAQEIAGNIGSSIGSFLNPIFGSQTVTTTTEPSEAATKAGSKSLLIIVVLAVLVIGGFLLIKKSNSVA